MHLVELSRSEHQGLRIRADRVEAGAARQHLIPIVMGEFRKAATQYPIVFAKHPETARFAPYVLSGLGLEENLFWSGTELDVAYVPLNVRRQPFYVGADNELCIDLDHPCLDGSGTRVLVNADGSDSAYLKEILAILGELVAGRAATEQFVATLLDLDLLAPIVLDIVLDDGSPLQVQGLYGLDEEKFRQLDEAKIAGLWQAGYLDLLYAVMIASGQLFKLIRLKNQRIALSRAWQGNAR
ncbi:SapC family protein [Steroidobacter flavus]|uniref:SapC family protein n=1 Tax=Steroidobacter flavus TaxID=1842136 RepID=A0ABV8T4U1_9GAMM